MGVTDIQVTFDLGSSSLTRFISFNLHVDFWGGIFMIVIISELWHFCLLIFLIHQVPFSTLFKGCGNNRHLFSPLPLRKTFQNFTNNYSTWHKHFVNMLSWVCIGNILCGIFAFVLMSKICMLVFLSSCPSQIIRFL